MSLPLSADIITLLRLSGRQSAVLDVIIRPPEDGGVSSTTPLVIRLEKICQAGRNESRHAVR